MKVVRLNKMRTIALLLIVLTLGLVATGCTKHAPVSQNIPSDTQTDSGALTIDDTTPNPDIGTLDDTNVSDEIPQ
jgi:hypothetical protein